MRDLVLNVNSNYNYVKDTIFHSCWHDNINDKYWFKSDNTPWTDFDTARRFITNCSVRDGHITKTITFPSDGTYYEARPLKWSLKLFVGGHEEDGTPIIDLGVDLDIQVRSTPGDVKTYGYLKAATNGGDEFLKLDIMEQDCPWTEAYLEDLANFTGFAYRYAIITSYTGGPTKIVYSTITIDNENHRVTIDFYISTIDSTSRQPYNYPYEYIHRVSGSNLTTAYQLVGEAVEAAENATAEAEHAAEIAQNIQDTFDQIDVNGLISI